MSIINKIRTGLNNYIELYLHRRQPVIVYTPGRVGSMSMIYALKKARVFAIKVERLENENWGSVRFCRNHIIKKNRSAKIVTLIRDPLEILISLFFSKAHRGHLPKAHNALLKNDLDGLQEAFVEELLNDYYLTEYVYWFENEFQPHTGIDIFNHTFNPSTGYEIVNHNTYPTLILRTDLTNETKEEHIKNFLGLEEFKLNNLNTKSKSQYGDIYKQFQSRLKLEPKWINKIYNSNYAQHFFLPEEIQKNKLQYLKIQQTISHLEK